MVGATRPDGKHEVVTVMQALDLADEIALEPAPRLEVRGFREDTLVRTALERLAQAAGVEPTWSVEIDKRIPVAAGLGGGSSDAATALNLANRTLDEPLSPEGLRNLAAAIGADVPFFLGPSPALGTGDGSTVVPLDLPQDYSVLLVLPTGVEKPSTAAVYAAFDERRGGAGFDGRRAALEAALAAVRKPTDLASLPANDLASSLLADELRRNGAFRADVTGAGPTVYGLFRDGSEAEQARAVVGVHGRTWIATPSWYG